MQPWQWEHQRNDRGASTTKESKGTQMHQPKQMAANVVAVYTAMLSTPGEQGAQMGLILKDPGSTPNLITHEFLQVLMLPGQAVSLSLKVVGHRKEPRWLQIYNLNIK